MKSRPVHDSPKRRGEGAYRRVCSHHRPRFLSCLVVDGFFYFFYGGSSINKSVSFVSSGDKSCLFYGTNSPATRSLTRIIVILITENYFSLNFASSSTKRERMLMLDKVRDKYLKLTGSGILKDNSLRRTI